ncbi:MAG: glycerol-3-phosphate 1-O-acyltransferase PlsY [Motiliproteus sp.]
MFSTLTSTDLALIAFAYLLGSVPSAIVVSRVFNLQDPRRHGSGNPGATNMLRTGHRTAAILTLIGDLAKGYLPVYVAIQLELQSINIGLVGLAAIIGHLLPIFYQFRGGKGVATSLGACLGFSLYLGLAQMICWVIVVGLSRTSSIAALTTALVTPALGFFLAPQYSLACLLIALLMFYRHRSNLQNLLKGNEHRL